MNALATDPVTMALHELRSPLGLVATAARSAADDCDDDMLRRRCEVIVRAAERMLKTAQTVISLAQTASLLKRSAFNPAASVRAIVDDLRAIGVQVSLLDETSAEEYLFDGIREQFETLVTSLISNALDHAEPSTVLEVHLACAGDEFAARVSNKLCSGRSGHAGLGVGNYIADQLAGIIPATIKRSVCESQYSVEVTMPVIRGSVAAARDYRGVAASPA